MLKDSAPRKYVTTDYLEYQRKYAENVRESDKILMSLIADEALAKAPDHGAISLLDIGCSSGNLLRHMKQAFPSVHYLGGDLFPEIIDHCRHAAGLEGIDFAVMDIRDLSSVKPVDITVISAVLFRFPDDEFELALDSLAHVTKKGGWIFGFDLFHPFEQTLTIGEKSALHPEGLTLVYRPYSEVSRLLENRGFGDLWFKTFDIPIDLPKPTSLTDINTYTVKAADGYRLNFRGSLFLPWCHWGARKLGS